jgi:thioesterase domain-containing protein/aryl carrier-like protein
MLGVEQVAADDNFFDLGGHSLLAVQFVNKLRKRTGRRLAATILVEAPTVAQLAARVGPIGGEPTPAAADPDASAPPPGEGRRSGEAAILIREGGHGIPLFLVHDGMGEILLYRTLAMKLDPGRPVYGLVPTTRADGSIVETEISGMAAAHLAKVRQVQPHGPYLLAGMCAGGVIAFEMARQLEDAGEEVLFVGIIDAADVAARERPFFVSRLRLKRFARALVPGAAGQERASGSTVGELAGKVGRFVSYEGRRGIETLRNRRTVQALRRREADEPAEALAAPPPSNEPLSFLDIYNIAHREHRPRGVLSRAELVLYRATQDSGEPGDMPYAEQYSDVALGWGQRVAEGLQVVAIPGGHTSSLQEPHVGQLARAMQDAISGAIARAEERKRLRGSARSEADARAEPPLAEALS